jgi:sialate O-acetylesterase
MNNFKKVILCLLGAAIFVSQVAAQTGKTLQLAGIFGDNAVIQQGTNAPVWGMAAPSATIRIEFAGYTSFAKANNDGKWMLRMPALQAGGPFDMKVTGEDTIILKNLMVGEVWLASGQSNMEWRFSAGVGEKTKQYIAEANYPLIRLFNVPRITANSPLADIEPSAWQICSPATVKDFSAIAYFFGQNVHKHLDVAVGIINSSWGATNVEAWMSAEVLATHPDFRNKVIYADNDLAKWNEFVKNSIQADLTRDDMAKSANEGIKTGANTLNYNDHAWTKSVYPMDMNTIGLSGYWGLVWFRKHFELSKQDAGQKFKAHIPMNAREAIIYINGKEITTFQFPNGVKEFEIPAKILTLGKNMLAIRYYVHWGSAYIGTKAEECLLTGLKSNAKIDLSGEWSCSSKIEPQLPQWQDYYNKQSVQYNGRIAPIIPYGIKGAIWYQGESNSGKAAQYAQLFPMMINDWRVRWQQGYFPFLFVQLANFKDRQAEPSDDEWAYLREAQLKTLDQPNTGMAVSIDIGEANDIHPRNKFDVGQRLYLAALKTAYNAHVVSSGPKFESFSIEENKIRLKFSSIGSGLIAKGSGKLSGFAIAGADKVYHWADAVIDGSDVVVSSPLVSVPVSARYAWAANPECNLYNKERLPASPFRTDN